MTYKTNRRPNFKRNNNYSSSKGRNKGNVTQQYNKYLKLAKDTFSAGDRIQAEYYYQFTDHYYRLMQELGINLDDQDNLSEPKDANSENNITENEKEIKLNSEEDTDTNKVEDDVVDDSIESIPFISEPVKKKRTISSK
jgi:acetyl-CoA acetyltransferase